MTPKELTRAKIDLYGELVRDPKLHAIDLRVAWLLVFQYLNSKSMDAFPSADTLANDLSVSLSTVWRSIKRLTSPNGYFAITKHGGRGHSNHYRPNLETVSALTPFKEEETVSTVTPFAKETVSSVTINSVKSRQETVSQVKRESLEESNKESLRARAARFATPDGDARGAPLKKRSRSAMRKEDLDSALYYRRQELKSPGGMRFTGDLLSDRDRQAADEWLREHGEIGAKQGSGNGLDAAP